MRLEDVFCSDCSVTLERLMDVEQQLADCESDHRQQVDKAVELHREVERLKVLETPMKVWLEREQQLRSALEKIRFLLADKAERIPMTNFAREIDKIAEQALKGEEK